MDDDILLALSKLFSKHLIILLLPDNDIPIQLTCFID